GVETRVGHDVDDLSALNGADDVVVVCTGGRSGVRTYEVGEGALVLDAASPSLFDEIGARTVAIWDPIGGPIAVAIAERLGSRAALITPDQIAGNELSRTGDLAPANSRLQQQGVRIERRAVLKAVRFGEAEIEDRFTAARRTVSCEVLVDAGFRLPEDALWIAGGRQHRRAGDVVAPRTISEAVLEGRRVAMALDA
ncbi:MAG: 2,4-dienoyl-CoA reductase, partial [Acidimicrobiia bacterium]